MLNIFYLKKKIVIFKFKDQKQVCLGFTYFYLLLFREKP